MVTCQNEDGFLPAWSRCKRNVATDLSFFRARVAGLTQRERRAEGNSFRNTFDVLSDVCPETRVAQTPVLKPAQTIAHTTHAAGGARLANKITTHIPFISYPPLCNNRPHTSTYGEGSSATSTTSAARQPAHVAVHTTGLYHTYHTRHERIEGGEEKRDLMLGHGAEIEGGVRDRKVATPTEIEAQQGDGRRGKRSGTCLRNVAVRPGSEIGQGLCSSYGHGGLSCMCGVGVSAKYVVSWKNAMQCHECASTCHIIDNNDNNDNIQQRRNPEQ